MPRFGTVDKKDVNDSWDRLRASHLADLVLAGHIVLFRCNQDLHYIMEQQPADSTNESSLLVEL